MSEGKLTTNEVSLLQKDIEVYDVEWWHTLTDANEIIVNAAPTTSGLFDFMKPTQRDDDAGESDISEEEDEISMEEDESLAEVDESSVREDESSADEGESSTEDGNCSTEDDAESAHVDENEE